MGRRVYIIPVSSKVDDAISSAKLADCSEICLGIPPRLEGVIKEAALPLAYEESDPPSLIDWQTEWDKALAEDKINVLAKMLGIKP